MLELVSFKFQLLSCHYFLEMKNISLASNAQVGGSNSAVCVPFLLHMTSHYHYFSILICLELEVLLS